MIHLKANITKAMLRGIESAAADLGRRARSVSLLEENWAQQHSGPLRRKKTNTMLTRIITDRKLFWEFPVADTDS